MLSQIALSLLLRYKYVFLFPVGILEGPLITIASGFFVSQGIFNPVLALAVLAAADVTGDLIFYALGHYGATWRITEWLFRRSHFEKRKERLGRVFQKRPVRIVLFGKLTHALAVPIMITAGYFGMELWTFFVVNVIGSTIKTAMLMYIGFALGAAYVSFASDFATASMAVLLLVIIMAAYFMLRKQTEVGILDETL